MGLVKDDSEVIAKEFEFSDDAGGNEKGGTSLDGLVDFVLQVEFLLYQEADEVAIDEELVGFVEGVVDPEEVDDAVHLLIEHCKERIYK